MNLKHEVDAFLLVYVLRLRIIVLVVDWAVTHQPKEKKNPSTDLMTYSVSPLINYYFRIWVSSPKKDSLFLMESTFYKKAYFENFAFPKLIRSQFPLLEKNLIKSTGFSIHSLMWIKTLTYWKKVYNICVIMWSLEPHSNYVQTLVPRPKILPSLRLSLLIC